MQSVTSKTNQRRIDYDSFGGVGHGPSKPKSNRASMDYNLEWFDQDFFTAAPKNSAQR